jgi:hypothetical protein
MMANKMKKTLFTSYLVALSHFVFSQVNFIQVIIPLDNMKGVPYQTTMGTYDLGGFEVDVNGCFYFLGGTQTTLAVFKQNAPLFRKQYKEFDSGNLFIYNNKIYTLDITYNYSVRKSKNNLVELNLLDGSINEIYDHIITAPFDTYTFIDDCLIVQKASNVAPAYKPTFTKYSLLTHLKNQIENNYDLPPQFYPKKYADEGVNFLGIWNNCHIYQGSTIKNNLVQTTFWEVDSDGHTLLSKAIDNNLLGKSFINTPNEFVKFKNGYIYVVGFKGKNAIITKIAIKDLF